MHGLNYLSVVVKVQEDGGSWEGQGWLPFNAACEGGHCSLIMAWRQVGKALVEKFGCEGDLLVEFAFVHTVALGMQAAQLREQHRQGQNLAGGVMGWTEIDKVTFRPTEGGTNGEVKG